MNQSSSGARGGVEKRPLLMAKRVLARPEDRMLARYVQEGGLNHTNLGQATLCDLRMARLEALDAPAPPQGAVARGVAPPRGRTAPTDAIVPSVVGGVGRSRTPVSRRVSRCSPRLDWSAAETEPRRPRGTFPHTRTGDIYVSWW